MIDECAGDLPGIGFSKKVIFTLPLASNTGIVRQGCCAVVTFDRSLIVKF